MESPKFLSIRNIIRIQEDMIARYGGSAGVRDMNLLESATAMPCAGFGDHYLHEDLFAMAAAYLFHIIKNHPLLDGNKRTGAMAAYVFLAANDHEIDVSEGEFEAICLGVAEGKTSKDEVAEFIRKTAQ